MALTVVLSVGFDPELLATRNLVLQSAGYTVVAAYSIDEAIKSFHEGDFDLVLVCPSIPPKEKNSLSRWIRASGSRVPVVCVSGRFRQDGEFAGVRVDSDPAALLWGIREMLINAETSAARSAAGDDKQRTTAAGAKNQPAPNPGDDQHQRKIRERLFPFARTG